MGNWKIYIWKIEKRGNLLDFVHLCIFKKKKKKEEEEHTTINKQMLKPNETYRNRWKHIER